MGSKFWGAWCAALSLLGGAWLAVACSSSSSDAVTKDEVWRCKDEFACVCSKTGEEFGVGIAVERCLPSDCCVLSRAGAPGSTCECTMKFPGVRPGEGPSCEETAANNGGVVVDQCPPPGEPVVSDLCAAPGEGCTVSELQASKHAGCCVGSVCKLDAAGKAKCEVASDAEQALSIACEHAARSLATGVREPSLVTTALETSLGTVQLPNRAVGSTTGLASAGCLVSFEVSFGVPDCGLLLDVDTIAGKLVVRSISGSFAGCVGFEGDRSQLLVGRVYDASDPPVTLTFDGFSCGSSQLQLNGCVAGVFDFRIDGELASTKFVDDENNPPPTITLVDQHLRFEGTACAAYDYRDVVCPQ